MNDNGTYRCGVCGVVIDEWRCATIYATHPAEWDEGDRSIDEELCDDCAPGPGEIAAWLAERRKALDASRAIVRDTNELVRNTNNPAETPREKGNP